RAAGSADEMTICQNGDLARLDQQLAAAYRRDMAKLGQEQRDQFQQNEVSFLNARRRCGENQRCLEQSYHNRIQELRNLRSAGEERDGAAGALAVGEEKEDRPIERRSDRKAVPPQRLDAAAGASTAAKTEPRDRKSTRLNSSHQIISYAVFCLKKKKENTTH